MPAAGAGGETNCCAPRRFEFAHDTFAFANELHWEYRFQPSSGKTTFTRRQPPPDYAHRCFVLARTARQFLYHARFDPRQLSAEDEDYRSLIREVVSRNPRKSCPPADCVVLPGFAHLREFSAARERVLKAECGGAWRSYVLRSHWRMVFPISRAHQARTAALLEKEIRQGGSPIIHLVRFPQLTINHGMLLFNVSATDPGFVFEAYDPNDPARPTTLSYDATRRMFFLRPNPYWAGGQVNVIEIYRGWLL